MNRDRFPPLPAGKGPALCLDNVHFAHRVFGNDIERWFDGSSMTYLMGQACQLLQPEAVIVPLLDWIQAKWSGDIGALPFATRPGKVLDQAFQREELRSHLSDLLRALAPATRSAPAVALGIAPLEAWLRWAGGDVDAQLDEADAEDVCVYLAALFNHLPPDAVEGLCLFVDHGVDGDCDIAYEPLLNAARHFDWPVLAAAAGNVALPRGCAAYARSVPANAEAMLLDARQWDGSMAQPQVSLIVSTIPVEWTAAQAMEFVAKLRESAVQDPQ